MTKLTIITINLNNADGLRKTIESVVSQTFTDYEYIIIDGASTDGSVDVIKRYADKITYWVSEADKGIYNAMNKGIKVAQSEYCLFLNSGDWLFDNITLENVFKLDRTEDILYGDFYSVSEDGTLKLVTYPSTLTLNFFLDNTICHQATFTKRNLLVEDPYNELFKIASDWEFLVKHIILKNCSTFKLYNKIVYYQDFGISSNPKFTQLHLIERKTILYSYFSERILLDYAKLSKLHEEQNTRFFTNIRFVMQYPKLQKFVRRLIKIVVVVFCFIRRIPKPNHKLKL